MVYGWILLQFLSELYNLFHMTDFTFMFYFNLIDARKHIKRKIIRGLIYLVKFEKKIYTT